MGCGYEHESKKGRTTDWAIFAVNYLFLGFYYALLPHCVASTDLNSNLLLLHRLPQFLVKTFTFLRKSMVCHGRKPGKAAGTLTISCRWFELSSQAPRSFPSPVARGPSQLLLVVKLNGTGVARVGVAVSYRSKNERDTFLYRLISLRYPLLP